MKKTAIIIGGGYGGLCTGAMLTREGYRVTVLEKNLAMGGGLQSFARKGLHFETGMHVLAGLAEGQTLWRIFNYLGIMDKLQLKRCDEDCMDQITYLAAGKTFRIPQGRDAFVKYLCQEFPGETEGIRRYTDACYALADEVAIFNLRPSLSPFAVYSEQFMQPADEFIASYVTDERLRDLLAYMNPLYGGVAGKTPAYIHAIVNILYIGGQYHFIGRSQHMAELFAGIITEGGGEVLLGKTVKAVHGADKQVESVETTDGQTYKADCYISAVCPALLDDIVDDGLLSKAYRSRITSLPYTYSAFVLYVSLKPETFPYINHTCYVQDDFGMVWQHGEFDEETWPRGMMYLTPATPDQGPWATRLTVNCVIPWSVVSQWKDSRVGRRPAEYLQWKEKMAQRIIAKLERLHPGFAESIADYYTASPLTIRDYYGSPEGTLYGYQKDGQNPLLTMLLPTTKVKNFYLTGQCLNLHGICGVPLTSINTVEAIVGQNVIIDKLNNDTCENE